MNIKSPAFVASLGLIALILGLTGWYMATHPAPAPFSGEQQNVPVSETREKITENGQYYSIDVTYPTEISFPLSSRSDAGAKAETVMKGWVDTNVSEFKGYIAENEAAIKDFAARGEEVPASFTSLSLTLDYEKKQGPRTITYLFSSASYTGGAHGIEVPVTFTFNATTGEQVKLADLFTPQSAYLEQLSQIARADLPQILGDYRVPEFVEDGTRPVPENFSVFYLEGDTIVFLFSPYQVAPYVVGTVELPVKLARLGEMLQTQYK